MEHLEGETVESMEAFGGLRSDPCCDSPKTETILGLYVSKDVDKRYDAYGFEFVKNIDVMNTIF